MGDYEEVAAAEEKSQEIEINIMLYVRDRDIRREQIGHSSIRSTYFSSDQAKEDMNSNKDLSPRKVDLRRLRI